MAATLADVAARAGVSTATVSRVLNGNYPVSAVTNSRSTTDFSLASSARASCSGSDLRLCAT